MNETRESRTLLEEWGHLPLAELPAEVRARVDACPICREHFDRAHRLVSLLQLKRHELPELSFEGRLLHRVSTRLQSTAELDRVRASEVAAPEARRWAWIGPLALAAALAVAFGVNQFTQKELRQTQSLAVNDGASPAIGTNRVGTPSITEQQVKDMFAVKATTSNEIDRIIAAVEEAGYQVLVSTNQSSILVRPDKPSTLPVINK